MIKFRLSHSVKSPLSQGWAAPAGLLILIVFHLIGAIPFQDTVRNYAFDLYQSLLPRERISSPVVIVDIDEESLKQYGQWPWPRSLVARLIDKIATLNPAAIGLDIIMPEPDRSSPCQSTAFIPQVTDELKEQICRLPSNDEILARSLHTHHAVLGVAGIDDAMPVTIHVSPMLSVGESPFPWLKTFSSALVNIDVLQNAAAGHAILSTEVEHGVIRRIPLVAAVGNTVLPALSLEMLRIASGQPAFKVKTTEQGIDQVGIGDLMIPTQKDGSIYVHYSKHDPSRFVSAAALLNDSVKPENLERRLVLLGFSGLGLVDYPTTAIGDRVPGVEIHAQALETIFDQTTIVRPAWAIWLEALFILVLGLAVIYILPRLKALPQIVVLVSSIMGLATAGLLSFEKSYLLLDVASPMLLFLILYFAMLADSLIRDESQIEVLEDDLRLQREQAAKVQGEMEAAKRFQMGILPIASQAFANEHRIDIAATMEPAKMVGGDLYDFFRLDEDHIFFSLGDVCGKGVPASLFMVISKTLCKSVALRDNADYVQLGQLISQANREISRDNPEMLFVTAFMGIINLKSGELTYCNAGHERPLIFAPNCKPKELSEASGPPISVMDEIEYKTHTYKLSSEEFICVFTDGVTEAINDQEQLYGRERLLAALEDIESTDTAESVMNLACESVHRFVGDVEPFDDLTMLVVRWRGMNAQTA